MDAQFYLYFPSENGARDAAARLNQQGYGVTVRPGADDINWLALASRSLADDTELDEAEEALEQLASNLGGEYDGYER